MIKTAIGRFRIVAFLEGLSFLILLGIAMPLKYYGDMPEVTRVVGMIHGVLFIAYLYSMVPVAKKYAWNMKTISIVFGASLVPIGTFIADHRIFSKLA